MTSRPCTSLVNRSSKRSRHDSQAAAVDRQGAAISSASFLSQSRKTPECTYEPLMNPPALEQSIRAYHPRHHECFRSRCLSKWRVPTYRTGNLVQLPCTLRGNRCSRRVLELLFHLFGRGGHLGREKSSLWACQLTKLSDHRRALRDLRCQCVDANMVRQEPGHHNVREMEHCRLG